MPRTKKAPKRSKNPVKKVSKALRKYVKKAILRNTETKYTTRDLETDFSSIPADFGVRGGSGGIQLDLAGLITQGDTAIQRDGNDIYIKNIQFKGIIALGDTSNITRIVVVRAVPTLDLSYTGGAGADANIFTEFGKPSDVDGIHKVLYDKLVLQTANVTQSQRVIQFSIPINRRFSYKFGANTGDTESYFIYMVSDSAAVAHPGFIGGRVRVWFKEV